MNDRIIGDYDHVVLHFDGNNNDPDDIAAMPMAALLVEAAGLEDEVSFFFGNNLSEKNRGDQLSRLRQSAEFVESLGIDVVDYQANEGVGTEALVSIFNDASLDEILVLDGGPMEATFRALSETAPGRLDNITQLSHSSWNENRDVGGGRTWDDIAEAFPQVTQIEIDDQNQGNNNTRGFNNRDWDWMDDATDPTIEAAREAMIRAGTTKRNDPSDAGMLFYALTGEERGTPQDVEAFLEASGAFDFGDDAEGEPETPTEPSMPEEPDTTDGDPEPADPEPEEPEAPGDDPADDAAGGPADLVAAYNIGGGAHTSVDGILHAADTVSKGKTFSVPGAIAGTDDDALFRSEAWRPGTLEVEIGDIAPGRYAVELDFAEIYGGTREPGARVFDVRIEGGATALDDYDIAADVGFRTATTKRFEVEVDDGTLDIDLLAETQNPKLSAVRVFAVDEAAPTGETPTDEAPTGETPTEETPADEAAGVPDTFEIFLVDTETDERIAPLNDGDTIDADLLDGRSTGIAIETDDPAVESVRLGLDGYLRLERVEPYSLFGDRGGDYLDGAGVGTGSRTLEVEAFASGNGTGPAIESFEVDFLVA
ncbi:MAG: malectin domain-containing carbohydrate-binding protein [Paracoccaceae bacterium]